MSKAHKVVRVICPTRIDFTGGFTDVLPFRAKQWVSHVNLAIDLVVEVILKTRSDMQIKIVDNRNNIAIQVPSINEIDDHLSLIKVALRKFSIEGNISLTINSRAPSGAGLGTSGALSIGLTAALILFTDKVLPNNLLDLAIMAAKIERESGVLGGLQDQFAAANGGLNLFRFYGSEYSSKRISLPNSYILGLKEHLFILYPGGKRRSTDIVTKVMNGYQYGNVQVKNALYALDSMALEIINALQSANWHKLSDLLDTVRYHQLKLNSELVNKFNQKIINELKAKNVNGVKFLGGGGPGACMLVVCPDQKSKSVIKYVSKNNYIEILPVCYIEDGLRVESSPQNKLNKND
ncbi:MAG: hypothetical protein Q8P20_10975 [bacterium]|nr:hypothetical protein [bacterium]